MPKWPTSSPALSTCGPTADAPRPRGSGRALIFAIRAYRLLLAPVLPAACRFAPTCSVFASDAIAEHGSIRGGLLAIRRIARCHPWHPGGYDPVPRRGVG